MNDKTRKPGRPAIGSYRFTVNLAEREGKAVEKIAKGNKQSGSSVIREILEKYFKKVKQ